MWVLNLDDFGIGFTLQSNVTESVEASGELGEETRSQTEAG